MVLLLRLLTIKSDFVFYSDRLSSLVLEHALSLLPYGDNTVITPTGMPYQGKVFTAKVYISAYFSF